MNNMSFGVSMSNDFKVGVETTNNRGFTPEETALRCVNKIIGVSDNAPPAIRDQARAYRSEMEKINWPCMITAPVSPRQQLRTLLVTRLLVRITQRRATFLPV
jgi:hypothetical protein